MNHFFRTVVRVAREGLIHGNANSPQGLFTIGRNAMISFVGWVSKAQATGTARAARDPTCRMPNIFRCWVTAAPNPTYERSLREPSHPLPNHPPLRRGGGTLNRKQPLVNIIRHFMFETLEQR